MNYINILSQKSPVDIALYFAQTKNFKAAIFGYSASAVSVVMWASLNAGYQPAAGLILHIISTFLFTLIMSLFFTAMAHLYLDFSSGKGKAGGLFILAGVSSFISAVLIPLAIITYAFWPRGNFSLILFAVSILQFVFLAKTIKRFYSVSLISAWGAILAPFVGLALLGIFIIATIISLLLISLTSLL